MATFRKVTRGAEVRTRLQWGRAFQNAAHSHGAFRGRIVRGAKRTPRHKLVWRAYKPDYEVVGHDESRTRQFTMPGRYVYVVQLPQRYSRLQVRH